MRSLISCGLVTVLAGFAPCQSTGRTMDVVAPTVLGQSATFGLSHPSAAIGNPYVFLWCMPPFAGTQPLVVPGVAVQGVLRVAPSTSVASFSGVFGAGGRVLHSLSIPSDPLFLGVAWDLQAIDLAVATMTLSLADNELELVVVDAPPASLNMVAITPGSYSRGSGAFAGQYPSTANELPVHSVTLSRPFWMGRYEVTQAEYQARMGSNPSLWPGASRPVDRVTWHDAMAYCAVLTAAERAAGRLPAGYVYRLPTEAEWEYCCRAGTVTEWNVGNHLDCAQANFYHEQANAHCVGQTSVVGSHAANAWGLHDMHGNVMEWCLDGWDGTANYPSGPAADPYVASGPFRVVRGGSWSYFSLVNRSAFRSWMFPDFTTDSFGFRIVCAPIVP